MRPVRLWPWLWLAVAACDPPRPARCAVECTAENSDCATLPYERLPARCTEICYWGGCCELMNGAWQMATVDCARPVDAGVDAPQDGA
jgi:hypothetical protein